MARNQPYRESSIRDYIKNNLDLVEPGLRLVGKEFELPNSSGARGFVDILARDRFGHVLVIEIKISDSAARSALNELQKYVALLRNNYGLASDKVRCLVLSTSWHELLVPFSEYARSVDYHVEGREIVLNNQFDPIDLKVVELAPEAVSSRICPHHVIYFFHNFASCESALNVIDREFRQIAVRDYLAILMQRDAQMEGSSHALYLATEAFGKMQRADAERYISSLRERLFDGEWAHERTVLISVGLNIKPAETEIGYPEKFGQMLEGWTVLSIARRGRFQTPSVLRSDEELCSELAGHEGDSAIVFQAICSPRYKPSWERVKSKSEYCLGGNPTWKKGLELFMDESETEQTGSLSVSVYNPLDFLMSLCMLVSRVDSNYLPWMQVVRENRNGQEISILLGYLVWDGKTCPEFPERVVKKFFGGVFEYFVYRNFGDAWRKEAHVLKAHGLSYALCELTLQRGQVTNRQKWILKDGQLERMPMGGDVVDGVLGLAVENKSYVQALVCLFGEHGFGG